MYLYILNKLLILELDKHTTSNKYILNLHYNDVESSSNPRQIHIESTSNPYRIDIESFCQFDVKILVKILIESLSNPYRIDVKFTSNRRRILVNLTSKSSSKSSSNPYRILIEPLSIRREFDVESSSNRCRILVESTSNISTSIRHRIDQVKIVDSTSNRHRIDIESTSLILIEILQRSCLGLKIQICRSF